MKKFKFKIATKIEPHWEIVSGEKIKIGNEYYGIHKQVEHEFWGDFDSWVVTDLSTGSIVCYDFTKEVAVEIATSRILSSDMNKIRTPILAQLKSFGLSIPLNEI
jgi:hypothetical protein